jgi:FkbM family methyltransferase
MTTSFVGRNLQRLRNVRDYCREIGVPGTVALVRQKVAHVPVFELKVRGIATPVYCRAQGSDFAVLRQVLGHQDAAIKLDHPPKLVVDAGANVGYSSLLFMLHYPSATIVGIEPDRTNCELFRKNCGAYSNIRLLEGAVWPRSKALAITNPEADPWAFQVNETATGERDDLVRGYTIPEIIDIHGGGRVDLLKLDIEGAEYALFTEGAEEWLPRVDVILVELHDHLVKGCRAAFDRLLQDVPHVREQRGEYDCARLLRSPH